MCTRLNKYVQKGAGCSRLKYLIYVIRAEFYIL